MLSKCANPDCSAAFHYYGQGRLFEVHFEDADLCEKAGRMPFDQAMTKHDRSVEHFWLCADCADRLTVALDRQNNVLVLPRRKDVQTAPPLFRRATAS